jgi:RNA polymerase sigma factor (sigma-70 family)
MNDHPTQPHGSLVDAAMAGDRPAMRALWQQHRRWVAAVLLAHKPNSADLDDLLQDVAITLLAKVHTLDEPGSFVPWLRMIALNTARLAGRRFAAAPRMVPLESGSADSGHDGGGGAGGGGWEVTPKIKRGDTSPDGGATLNEESRRLLEMARDLPEEYREPLLLRCVQELSYRQISAILNLPETTIETRIARARRMLRERATGQATNPSQSETRPQSRGNHGTSGGEGGTGGTGASQFACTSAKSPSPSHPHLGGGARVGVFRDPRGGP